MRRPCHVCAMWWKLSRPPQACGYPDTVWQKGNRGKRSEPSQKTAVHASFLFLMPLPSHPRDRLENNIQAFSKYKRFFFNCFQIFLPPPFSLGLTDRRRVSLQKKFLPGPQWLQQLVCCVKWKYLVILVVCYFALLQQMFWSILVAEQHHNK